MTEIPGEGEHLLLPHRDDLPFEVVEAFEQMVQEQFPGYKLVFAGDHPEHVPPGLLEAVAELQARHDRSLAEGRCIDCDKQMPNWPPEDNDWKPPKDWAWFSSGEGDAKRIMAWQCPECDAAERAEGDHEESKN